MYGCRQCLEETRGEHWLKRVFACVPSVIDYHWRLRDFAFHRSWGGLSGRYLGVDGHAPIAVLLPAALALFVVYGPTLGWRDWGAVVVIVVALLALVVSARAAGPRRLMNAEFVLLALLAGVVWFWPGAYAAREVDPHVYRHWVVPLYVLLVALPLLAARSLARGVVRSLGAGDTFRSLLPHANLFAPSPKAPIPTIGSIVRSLVNVPLAYPHHLLFFPSLVLLLLPYSFDALWWAVGLLIVVWLLLSFAGTHRRFDSMLPMIRRAFFIGGQSVVSLVVIVLAVGKVVGISYVKTVVESSSWTTLLSYVLAAYVVFWFFEYWLNRCLLEELLTLLQGPDDPLGQARYSGAPGEAFAESSAVEPEGRVIQIHGGGRLVSIGRLKDRDEEAFQLFEKRELFERLVEKASWSPLVGGRARSESTREMLSKLNRRVRFYFSFANLLAIAVVSACLWILFDLPQRSLATVSSAEEGVGLDLAELLWGDETREDVVLLAASGGGTRAALYGASVLRGLHSIDALADVVLVSGVSGGGASLAYLAAYREALLPSGTDAAWTDFVCAMSYPYIWDVLEGAAEWRIIAGTRSGKLLSESLHRAFEGERTEESVTEARRTLGEVEDLTLILNTALSGHLECEECADEDDFVRAVSRADRRARTDGSVAGGRLIFTNLRHSDAFPLAHSGTSMPYVVVRDPSVSLPTAAALNANFPPVFSNAPVDRDRTDRYWVTDGGATDNRGLISLLYALSHALGRMPVDLEQPPDIHVVMAEASAGSRAYSIQERGVGTKFGAPGKIASGLIGELLEAATELYAARGGRVFYHDLAMPEFLRIDGGLGTHWMLPRSVRLDEPGTERPRDLVVDGVTVRQLIWDMHQADWADEVKLCAGERRRRLGKAGQLAKMRVVQGWMAAEPHRAAWDELREALGQ